MNTALWIVQAILGVMMLILGLMKTFQPIEKRFVGLLELLIGVGLILPQQTGIMPGLTSLAAFSVCIIMVLAIAEHVKHKETSEIGKNVIIMVLAAFVAVGRFVPFQ